jgi:hypothetical protein
VRYISRLQHYLALKTEIFSSTDRAFYKNAQIFTTVRLALTLFLELICFKIIADRFALLKYINQNAKTVSILNTVRFTLLSFLAKKRRILGRKTVRLAPRDRERDKNCNGKR